MSTKCLRNAYEMSIIIEKIVIIWKLKIDFFGKVIKKRFFSIK